jgi:hypothetical protein
LHSLECFAGACDLLLPALALDVASTKVQLVVTDLLNDPVHLQKYFNVGVDGQEYLQFSLVCEALDLCFQLLPANIICLAKN